jgi:hypothetical protein
MFRRASLVQDKTEGDSGSKPEKHSPDCIAFHFFLPAKALATAAPEAKTIGLKSQLDAENCMEPLIP